MTHNEKVLALLSDGKPHSHHEIYGLYVVGHSRISDLRKRGYEIAQWRDGDDYIYQLVGGLTEPVKGSSPDGPRAEHPVSGSVSPTLFETPRGAYEEVA